MRMTIMMTNGKYAQFMGISSTFDFLKPMKFTYLYEGYRAILKEVTRRVFAIILMIS